MIAKARGQGRRPLRVNLAAASEWARCRASGSRRQTAARMVPVQRERAESSAAMTDRALALVSRVTLIAATMIVVTETAATMKIVVDGRSEIFPSNCEFVGKPRFCPYSALFISAAVRVRISGREVIISSC
jgi:hypothetical protein